MEVECPHCTKINSIEFAETYYSNKKPNISLTFKEASLVPHKRPTAHHPCSCLIALLPDTLLGSAIAEFLAATLCLAGSGCKFGRNLVRSVRRRVGL